MRARIGLLVSALAVAAPAQQPGGSVAVSIVDERGDPVPGAIVWTLPKAALDRRNWLPWELAAWSDNPHELLRRTGERRVADADGRLDTPGGSVIAAEHGPLAGVLEVPPDTRVSLDLRLAPDRWVVEVRDEAGTPVPGVPIGASTTADPLETRLALGLTDASGRLVVRAPKAVDVTRHVLRTAGDPAPPPPVALRFEVDGMYLAEHAVVLRLADATSPVVELRLPPVTRVEVRVPEWNGPLSQAVMLTRVSRAYEPDDVACYLDGGRWLALVARHPRDATEVRAELAATQIGRVARVPPDARDPFLIEITLDEGDIVVRGRVHDGDGRPVGPTRLEFTNRPDALRTWYPQTDGTGCFALVLRPGPAAGTELGLRVQASRDPALVGATATLTLPELSPGGRRDVGILTLAPR